MTLTAVTNLNHVRRSSIRRSKRTDLEAIHTWLLEEEAQEVHGNFLCNWSAIERSHRDGDLLVYIDGKTGLPLAFQLGRLIRPGILQVRYGYRRTGLGQKMVERCVALAKKRNQYLLYIECNPSTSIPFWQRMGFTLIKSDSERNYAFRIMDKPLELPADGNDVAVVIRFFPESKKWEAATKPYVVHSSRARVTPDGVVHLAERVQFHEEAFPNVRDVVVEIEVEGSYRFCDKAKYNKAQEIGVTRCMNGFYIDTVRLL